MGYEPLAVAGVAVGADVAERYLAFNDWDGHPEVEVAKVASLRAFRAKHLLLAGHVAFALTGSGEFALPRDWHTPRRLRSIREAGWAVHLVHGQNWLTFVSTQEELAFKTFVALYGCEDDRRNVGLLRDVLNDPTE
jgi:hypothetical protein